MRVSDAGLGEGFGVLRGLRIQRSKVSLELMKLRAFLVFWGLGA